MSRSARWRFIHQRALKRLVNIDSHKHAHTHIYIILVKEQKAWWQVWDSTNAVTLLHSGQCTPPIHCEVDPSVFEPPPDYTTLGPGRTEPMRDEDDNLLQFAIQQSLLDAGTEGDQVRGFIICPLCVDVGSYSSLFFQILFLAGHSCTSEKHYMVYWPLILLFPSFCASINNLKANDNCWVTLQGSLAWKCSWVVCVWFLGDNLGGPDQQPPGATVSTLRGRPSAGEVSRTWCGWSCFPLQGDSLCSSWSDDSCFIVTPVISWGLE